MDGVDGELRVIPEIRSAHFERTHRRPERVVLHTGEYADLDPTSRRGRLRRVSPWTAWTSAFRGPRRVVELPEPLWLRALPLTYSVGLAVRLADLFHRRRTLVVTYAMENNTPERLFRPLPPAGRRVLATAVRRLGETVYDRMAFASPAAEDCYRRAGVLPRTAATRTFLELMPPCTCATGTGTGESVVVFLGALEARKGVPDLLAAWAMLPARRNGWVLRIAGSGPLREQVVRAAADGSVEYLGAAGRAAVHTILRSAAVLVLPSRREGRWCEQIGLPITEGLAHGCRIVATPDTGLAPWLREHGHVVLPEDFTVGQLAEALSGALEDSARGADGVVDQLPLADTRILAEDWMYAPDPADLQPTSAAPDPAHHPSDASPGRT